jgi:hypothetical protein
LENTELHQINNLARQSSQEEHPARTRCCAAPIHAKNGLSSGADGLCMGPIALDRKNGTVQSSLRSRHSIRSLCGVLHRL